MNEIEQFITAFIEFEYEANKLRYDTTISDEECLKQKDSKNLYLHSIISHYSVGRISGELEKFFSKELITVKRNKVQKRTLFQIKKYKNPTYGEVLNDKIRGEDVYLCYTGDDEKRELNKYSVLWIISNTNEGLKIIDRWLFIRGKWTNTIVDSHKILNYGTFVEKKQFVAPEDETSLEDYLKEK